MQKSIISFLILLTLCFFKVNAQNSSCYPYISFECNSFNVPNNYQNNEQSKRQRVPKRHEYVYGEYNDGVLTIFFSKDEGLASVFVYDQSNCLTYFTTLSTSSDCTLSTPLYEGYSIHILTDLGNEYFTTIY